IEELHKYGITRIYSPDDGRHMGLEGMIEDVIKQCSLNPSEGEAFENPKWNGQLPLDEVKDIRLVARAISLAESGKNFSSILERISQKKVPSLIPASGIAFGKPMATEGG